MESIHRVSPVAVSTTFLFIQLPESWEEGLMKTIFLHLPKLLKCVWQYGNKIWPQGSSTTCVTLGLLKAIFFIITYLQAMRNRVYFFCSSHNDFLHELLHWLWLLRKQHSAKLKMRLSGLTRAALFSCVFFLNQRMPFNQDFLVLSTFWDLRSKMWKLPHKICKYL